MKSLCLFILFISLLNPASAQVISTIAGNGIPGFSGEGGPAISAQFDFLCGVATDKLGNIYVADRFNSVIQKIDTHGILFRFAGNGFSGESGDGGPATAASIELGPAVGIAIDSLGNVFIAAEGRVRKVNTAGIITTVAGIGSYGSSGDGGPATAAELRTATGLCFDKAGNLYIADEQSSNIRMVNTAGVISTIAGTTLGFSGDGGPATNAQLKTPRGIAFDDIGDMYIADGSSQRLRKINTLGIITSVAGGNPFGIPCCHSCAATSINLSPIDVAIDHSGNIYVSDISDDVIYRITADGTTSGFAGNCTSGFSGDVGPASAAQLYRPTMICIDNKGNLLIVDKGNCRLRKVWIGTTYTPTVKPGSSLLYVYPNPTVGKNFTCNAITADTNESVDLVITDVVGKFVTTLPCTTNTPATISLPVPAGMYFIFATTQSGNRMSAKIIVD